jgi:hypothetical protein
MLARPVARQRQIALHERGVGFPAVSATLRLERAPAKVREYLLRYPDLQTLIEDARD